MPSLHDQWNKQPTPGFGERFNDAVRPKGALKPRVQNAIRKIHMQISKLDSMLKNLQERDARLFQRVVEATQRHDTHTSTVLGNELAEIRKVTKILGNARMALEKIELRLTTTNDIGDTVVAIMPTMALMKNLKSSLGKIMPGAEQEIGQMADMLGGFMTESFAGDAAFGMDETSTAESDAILREAAAVAESSAGQKLPSVPTDTKEGATTKFSNF